MSTYCPIRPYLLHEDEGEALWFLGNLVTMKVTDEQTRRQLAVAEFVNTAGFAPPLHRHLAARPMPALRCCGLPPPTQPGHRGRCKRASQPAGSP
ncbi:MAG: hypothetical protein QG597_4877 [Actinomycetota bacterium]|nr:hypothetical protein [Actinomycetota bacterium]